jgi:BirA family biotin operon repressor/biotin-[acetyl-CoA-carboxylase] ligase
VIKEIIRFKEVSSTQDTARRFIAKKEEIAVVALSQNRGRGRQGRQWYSPLGGLYVSLLLFPHRHQSAVPLLASLAVIKSLEDLDFSKLAIHWPNDVLLNDRKVCGVICEQYQQSIICGIGINVNIKRFPRSTERATSLFLESDREFEIDEMLNNLIERFNQLYKEIEVEGLKIEAVQHYISGIGEQVEVVTKRGVIRGVVCDIDDDWGLLIRDENGMIMKFYYGDVRRLLW